MGLRQFVKNYIDEPRGQDILKGRKFRTDRWRWLPSGCGQILWPASSTPYRRVPPCQEQDQEEDEEEEEEYEKDKEKERLHPLFLLFLWLFLIFILFLIILILLGFSGPNPVLCHNRWPRPKDGKQTQGA